MKAEDRRRALDEWARDRARQTIEAEVGRCSLPAAIRVALGEAERAARDAAGDDYHRPPHPSGPTLPQSRRSRRAYAAAIVAASEALATLAAEAKAMEAGL